MHCCHKPKSCSQTRVNDRPVRRAPHTTICKICQARSMRVKTKIMSIHKLKNELCKGHKKACRAVLLSQESDKCSTNRASCKTTNSGKAVTVPGVPQTTNHISNAVRQNKYIRDQRPRGEVNQTYGLPGVSTMHYRTAFERGVECMRAWIPQPPRTRGE